ncbi:oxidoreductase Fe-S subunit [Citrobacter amalonaticus]|nr:oxidoreductase Fe-S subunit [Citrobacter amalonaticus]
MNQVDRPLLDTGLTRLEFLRISGKGLAGLTIAPALLSLFGCKQEDIDSGTVGLISTPKGVLVTQRAAVPVAIGVKFLVPITMMVPSAPSFPALKFTVIISLATRDQAPAAACMAI